MPTTPRVNSDLESKILEGFGELRGAMRAVEDQLKRATERTDQGVQSSAENAAALKAQGERLERLENLNSSNAQSSINGYRELSSALDAVRAHATNLEKKIDRLTADAKSAAPAVADDIAERVDDKQKVYRRRATQAVAAVGGVSVLGVVVPAMNWLSLHPNVTRAVFSGLKRAVDAAVG